MVLIIAAAEKSVRSHVGRLLAEALGWEFVDAENLRAQGNFDDCRGNGPRPHADRTWSTKILSTAINLWIYEWRDVAVSCPPLSEEERKQLSGMSSLVKVVCLNEFHATDRTHAPDRLGGDSISQSPAGSHNSREQNVFTLDLFRPVDDIIAELTAVLLAS